MHILLINSRWPEDDSAFDTDFDLISKNAASQLSLATVHEADAMMSASLASVLLSVASIGAIAITIFSAPTTIEQNLPKWRNYFDKVVSFARTTATGSEISVDQNSARVLALEAVFDRSKCVSLRLVFAFRHFSHIGGGICEPLEGHLPEDYNALSGLDWNIEMSRQICARYIIGVEADRKNYTVIVESDGSISFIRAL